MRLAACLLALLSLAFAEKAVSPEFQQARELYYQGAGGDKQAYEHADKLFTELYRQRGNDARVKAYYGSLRLLEASHTWALWKKNGLSKEGIQLMDSAVSEAPDDLEVRFVRAATTYDLPGFFHRKEQSERDFDVLAERAEIAAREGSLEPRLAAASLYYHGEFLRDAGKKQAAMASWKQAIVIAPESRAAGQSRDALSKAAAGVVRHSDATL